jgi:hypothetical protein
MIWNINKKRKQETNRKKTGRGSRTVTGKERGT